MSAATPGFALFDTAIGPCVVVWGSDGLVGLHTPSGTPEATRRAVHRRFPEASEASPPQAVAAE